MVTDVARAVCAITCRALQAADSPSASSHGASTSTARVIRLGHAVTMSDTLHVVRTTSGVCCVAVAAVVVGLSMRKPGGLFLLRLLRVQVFGTFTCSHLTRLNLLLSVSWFGAACDHGCTVVRVCGCVCVCVACACMPTSSAWLATQPG